ncbi:MAG: hypothetical protein CMM52_04400 [Rhodospirillaceae bacterium]|nr:hypothetical protein [Rhodospirillaceae bacterium]|tara:strand:- start:59487 stop:60320 length:834 start_codon:yes stop_codon:yes gene_type:complete
MTARSLLFCYLISFGIFIPHSVAVARQAVDLELVIATDVSRSIDQAEAQLQRQGIAAAFRSKEIIKAISSGFLRRIAVAYIDYSSKFHNRIVVGWRILHDAKSAEGFAKELLKAPPTYGRRTSISDALELAAEMINSNKIEGTPRVIDVSGDGPNNWGGRVDKIRDLTTKNQITINGLPIMNDRGRFNSRYYLPDLDKYYLGCVIGGPGAFIVVANNFKDFARAVRRKLILEIAAHPAKIIPASFVAQRNFGKRRPIYEKGCDIGEKMRLIPWDDDT